MADIFAKAGEQIWSEDGTKGIEFVEDVYRHGHISHSMVKPLGGMGEILPNTPIPDWLYSIICAPGAYEAYKSSLDPKSKQS